MYRAFIKRFVDVIVALLVLVLTFPILIITLVALAIVNRGTPFFMQTRPGKGGVPFRVIKLKTMRDAVDSHGRDLPDSERLTKLGSIVRKTSIDEIPQLVNVLKGDMSLIGPRPLLMEYLDLYSTFQMRRHEVRPGITGWAQVNGRNNLSWPEKFQYDVYYVDNQSFIFDLKILWMTVLNVIRASDINQEGQSTVLKFKGETGDNEVGSIH